MIETAIANVAEIQKALEHIYQSQSAQIPLETLLADLEKIAIASHKIDTASSLQDKLDSLLNDYLPITNEIITRHRDFLSDQVIAKLQKRQNY